MGGNPNPTYGQVVGGAPGVGGFNNMNQGMGGQFPGQHHHHHHHHHGGY